MKRIFINLTTLPFLFFKGEGRRNFGEGQSTFTLPLISTSFKLGLGRILLLLVILVLVGAVASGCTPIGSQPKGWSGGIIADGTLFFGSMEGKVIGLNKADGGRLWELPLEASKRSGGFGCAPTSTAVAIYGTPAVAGDLVYIGGYNGKIYAVNSNSGAVRWVYPREGNFEPVVGGLVVALGKVYFGGSDGKVYALDATTGDKEWEFQTGGKIWSTPTIDKDTLFIGSLDKKFYALDVTDGSPKWAPFETEGAIVSTPIVYNDTVYFGSFDRHLYAVDATDGRLKWKSEVEAGSWFWTRPVAFNNTVYAGNLDGKVYALDADNGDKVAEFDLESPVSSSLVLVDGLIIVASEEGRVYALNTNNNQIRQIADVEEKIYAPLYASDGVIYIHTEKDILYALNAQTGIELWRYPSPSSK